MAKQTFEKAMKQLEAIVEELEKQDLSLDDAFKKFQEGITLSKLCASKLDETEKKVCLLLQGDDGTVERQDFLSEEALLESDSDGKDGASDV